MKFRMEPSGDKGVLKMDGELTIGRADKMKKALIRSMKKADHVTVDVIKVTDMDLTSLQLLCSAHRTFLNLNKTLVISSEGSDVFGRTVKEAGYSRDKGCALNPHQDCLWIGGV